MGDYSDKLRDPRWQKRRLEIMQRDGFRCKACGHDDMPLNVHHLRYRRGADPWDCERGDLITLCEDCHAEAHESGGSLGDIEQFMQSFLDRGVPLGWLMDMALHVDFELPPGLQLTDDEWRSLLIHFRHGLRRLAAAHGFQQTWLSGPTSRPVTTDAKD